MTSNILKNVALAAVLVASGPALAAPTVPEKTVLKYDAKTHKYCMTSPAVTGSRIRQTTCQTAVEWSALGFDMPKSTLLAQK